MAGAAPKQAKTEFVEIKFDDEDTRKANFSETLKQLQFYGLPIFSLFIFVAIVILAVVPNISGVFANLDEINRLKDEDKALAARITALQELQRQTALNQQLIDKINEIVPTGKSQVVDFRQRVATTAIAQGINLENSRSGEDLITDSPDSEEILTLSVIEIPSEFNLTGLFGGFRNFLNGLYIGEDFFIVDEMTLTANPLDTNPDNWAATINLVKYQFYADEAFNEAEFYSQVSENDLPQPEVVEFLQNRFLFNSNTLTDSITTNQ